MSDTEDDFGETGSINSDTDVDSEHGEMQEGNLSKKIMINHFIIKTQLLKNNWLSFSKLLKHKNPICSK